MVPVKVFTPLHKYTLLPHKLKFLFFFLFFFKSASPSLLLNHCGDEVPGVMTVL